MFLCFGVSPPPPAFFFESPTGEATAAASFALIFSIESSAVVEAASFALFSAILMRSMAQIGQADGRDETEVTAYFL